MDMSVRVVTCVPSQSQFRPKLTLFIGNFGIEINFGRPLSDSLRAKGKPLRHATMQQMDEAQASATIYYELHPQLWGQGLMSETFVEGVRFAFKECNVSRVRVRKPINNGGEMSMVIDLFC